MLKFLLFASAWAAAASPVPDGGLTSPTAVVKNGTYKGVHSAGYNQDFFLGVPFAQPPVKSLRFKNPAPLNESWEGVRDATKYSPECVGYGVSWLCFSVAGKMMLLTSPIGVADGL